MNALRKFWKSPRYSPCLRKGRCGRRHPDQIALAEKLVGDLDKARPEVIVEVAIMQVSRDKTRNLVISPPTSVTVALQSNLTNNYDHHQTIKPTNSVSSSTSGTANQINLNRLGNLNATDFTVTIPPATATALFGDSLPKLLQNPQIRAVDGQKASLKIGDRVPVATGSFQPGMVAWLLIHWLTPSSSILMSAST